MKKKTCPVCKGRKYIAHDPTHEPCGECGGTGKVLVLAKGDVPVVGKILDLMELLKKGK